MQSKKKSQMKQVPPKKTKKKPNSKVGKQKITNQKSSVIRSTPVKVKKTKIRYGRIFLVFVILFFLFYSASKLIHFPIRNIFISGNHNVTDQEIIEMLGIENYPSIFKTSRHDMERKLQSDIRIAQADVHKSFKSVTIKVVEATPLYYNQTLNRTILSTKEEVEGQWENAPVLLNYVPDTKYQEFQEKMLEIDPSIIERVSEITYQPNNVDEERFLFTMNDGNYVYLTLQKFDSINHYVSIYADITAKYGNKKGILNLDSGGYFTIVE